MVVKSLKFLLKLFFKTRIIFGIRNDLLYWHCFIVMCYKIVNICCAITYMLSPNTCMLLLNTFYVNT